MKGKFFSLLFVTALLASCSSKPESKETTYTTNVKGFVNGKSDEDGIPVFDILVLKTVIEDWDGGDKFSPNSGSEKLIKVELSAQTTESSVDLGILETNLALFDASTKKTYTASVSLSVGATFPAILERYQSGYAVYSVPSDAKLENLYIGIDKKNIKNDLSGEKVENLLPLKKLDAPKEESKDLNVSKTVESYDGTKTYTFKKITYNVNDDAVKKYIAEDTFEMHQPYYTFVRLDMDIATSSTSQETWITFPWLVSEYGFELTDYNFGERPNTIPPGSHSFSLYYRVYAGAKILGFNGEDRLGENYSVEIK